MLENAYVVAKFGVDTAENERFFAKTLIEKMQLPYPTLLTPRPGERAGHLAPGRLPRRRGPRGGPWRSFFWRARSRLYQNEILQVNMRLTAFSKLYKMCILLHRSKFNILANSSL